MPKFTIIVCLYNSSKNDVVYTLESILNQSLPDYEVLIADDGSEENLSKFIIEFFRLKDFKNYTLLFSKENRGTVKNIEEALNYASGKFIKPIGAGDAFADKDVLSRVCSFMEDRSSDFVFTDMFFFRRTKDGIAYLKNRSLPRVKSCYKKPEYLSRAVENIVVFNDQICGASIFYEKNRFIELIGCISGKVIYMEDLCQYIQLLDGGRVDYLASKCISYECNVGISNSKNANSNMRMKTDKKMFLLLISHMYSDNTFVKRRMAIERIDDETNSKILKLIKKTIVEPKWLYFRVLRKLI